jgi:hypothetical protein
MSHRVLLPSCLALLAAAAHGGVVHVPAEQPSVTAAIAAAADGDVILVKPGSYPEALDLDGRSLTIAADGIGSVTLRRIFVRNTVPADTVVLADLRFDATTSGLAVNDEDAITCLDCLGPVRLQNCIGRGDVGQTGTLSSPVLDGYAGLRVQSCASVAVTGGILLGGLGLDLDDKLFELVVPDGGPGVSVSDSQITLLGCVLTGGDGGSVLDTTSASAGDGGAALRSLSVSVCVEGCVLTGGKGGSGACDGVACGPGGQGGDVLRQDLPGATAYLVGNVMTPGLGGLAGDGTAAPAGGKFVGGAIWIMGLTYRSFVIASLLREGQPAVATFDAVPGDVVLLQVALEPGYAFTLPHEGTYLIGPPVLTLLAGVVPGGGILSTAPTTVPELGPGVDHATLYLQAIVDDGTDFLFAPGQVLTLLDAAE